MRQDEVKAEAARLWATFTENEKTGVRVGLFPHEKMLEGARALSHVRDHERRLAVALMELRA